jgi:hypothetical protein
MTPITGLRSAGTIFLSELPVSRRRRRNVGNEFEVLILDVGLTVNGGDFATTTQIGLVGI